MFSLAFAPLPIVQSGFDQFFSLSNRASNQRTLAHLPTVPGGQCDQMLGVKVARMFAKWPKKLQNKLLGHASITLLIWPREEFL